MESMSERFARLEREREEELKEYKLQQQLKIKKNTLGIKKVFNKFLSGKGSNKFVFLNNEKWLTKINYMSHVF